MTIRGWLIAGGGRAWRTTRREADMTNTRSQTRDGNSEGAPSRAFGSFENISKSMQSQAVALAALPYATLEAHLTMVSELYNFVGKRMKAQAELCHELSRCHEVADALDAQRRFSARATSDYSDKMTQMGSLLRKELSTVASEAVQEAGKAAKLAA
jgi:hypothetical protein